MNGNPFRPVRRGQSAEEPSAAFHNELLQLIRERRLRRRPPTPLGPAIGSLPEGVVYVRNDWADRDIGDAVGLAGLRFEASDDLVGFKNQFCFNAVQPSFPLHLGRFAVLLQPLKQNEIGLAQVAGTCRVKINVVLEEVHRFADVHNSSNKERLKTNYAGGAEILYVETGTGDKWAIVRLGTFHNPIMRGRLTAKLNQGGVADVRVQYGSRTGGTVTWSDGTSSEVVTVCDSLLRVDRELEFEDPENFVHFAYDRDMGQFVVQNWRECSVEDEDLPPEE